MACTAPALANNLSIQIEQNTQGNLRFDNLLAHTTPAATQISGRVSGTGLSGGHLDITAHAPDGTLISQTISKPAVLTYRAKRKGGALFAAQLQPSLPQGSTITIAFHASTLNCQGNGD